MTNSKNQGVTEMPAADEQLLKELTERARADGLKLTGRDGLLGQLAKMVIEGALEGEVDDHLGCAKHDPAGRDGGNSRNGHRGKTVLTEAGPVEISVPRDRDSSFEPKIAAKRQRRLTGAGDLVISLSAKGLTRGEISAHLAGVYGAEVSKQAITGRVTEGTAEWQNRPAGPGLRGHLHRRDPGQDPRGPGRQPARPPRPGVASVKCLKRARLARLTEDQSTPWLAHHPRKLATRPA